MVRLGVNIDHIATLREARKGGEPDPVVAAGLVELAGADGVVIHLREDRRHIKDRDLRAIKGVTKTHLNLEMAPTEEMVQLALEVVPDMCTIVPERREEVTTEGGVDVAGSEEFIEEVIARLRASNIVVSLFVEPEIQQIKAAAKASADYVELHTGRYANSPDLNTVIDELDKIKSMALAASKLGLGVSAGHGLNYQNVRDIARVDKIEELNIGHAIISRSLFVGLDRAVRDMLALIR